MYSTAHGLFPVYLVQLASGAIRNLCQRHIREHDAAGHEPEVGGRHTWLSVSCQECTA